MTGQTVTRRTFLTSATAGILLLGCGTNGRGQTAEGVQVTDQRGKTVKLARPAQRIVTIPIPAASMLMAVDRGADRLVGMNSASATAIRGAVLGDFYPKAGSIKADIAGSDFAPNVEAIAGVNPDVVVQWADEGQEIIAPLESAGLNVVGLAYGTQQQLERWVEIFAALIGKPERATSILGQMHAAEKDVRARRQATSLARPKIIYFNRLQGEMKVAGKGTYNDFYIDLVGGQNPAAGLNGMASVNVEQVAAWNPDIVLVGNFDAATPETVYGNSVWQDVSAVRSRRVYQVPLGGYRWDPPSQEAPLMWRWLAGLVEGSSGTVDLRGEIRKQYGLLYGVTPNDQQIDRILRLDRNGSAAGYERFSRR